MGFNAPWAGGLAEILELTPIFMCGSGEAGRAWRSARSPLACWPFAFTPLLFWSLPSALPCGSFPWTWPPYLFPAPPAGPSRGILSLRLGLATLAVGYGVDRRTRQDFAFWLYLFGTFMFWGGLVVQESHDEWRRFVWLLTNLSLIVTALLFERRVFIVFGAMGVVGYLGHLAHEVFQDSLMFPFALSFLGIALIATGVVCHRYRVALKREMHAFIPAALRQLLPPSRRSETP